MPRTNFSTSDGGGETIGERGTRSMGTCSVYKSASNTRAGLFHYTIVSSDGTIVCTCEGWLNHKKCWHHDLIQDHVFADSIEDGQCEHGTRDTRTCKQCDDAFAAKLLEDM